MERLTMRITDGNLSGEAIPAIIDGDRIPYGNLAYMEMLNRLCEYEDTNLTPAEIEAMKAENEALTARLHGMEQEMFGYASALGLAQGLLAEPKKEIIDGVHKATINAYRQEIETLKAERDAAVQVIYSCPTCTNCIHMDECDEIGGRCEGRGFGGDCHEPLPEPHFQWRGVE